jgi:hypothetical protein
VVIVVEVSDGLALNQSQFAGAQIANEKSDRPIAIAAAISWEDLSKKYCPKKDCIDHNTRS